MLVNFLYSSRKVCNMGTAQFYKTCTWEVPLRDFVDIFPLILSKLSSNSYIYKNGLSKRINTTSLACTHSPLAVRMLGLIIWPHHWSFSCQVEIIGACLCCLQAVVKLFMKDIVSLFLQLSFIVWEACCIGTLDGQGCSLVPFVTANKGKDVRRLLYMCLERLGIPLEVSDSSSDTALKN